MFKMILLLVAYYRTVTVTSHPKSNLVLLLGSVYVVRKIYFASISFRSLHFKNGKYALPIRVLYFYNTALYYVFREFYIYLSFYLSSLIFFFFYLFLYF